MKLNPVGYAKRFTKPYSKALSRQYRAFRVRAGVGAPGWANRVLDYFDLYFVIDLGKDQHCGK